MFNIEIFVVCARESVFWVKDTSNSSTPRNVHNGLNMIQQLKKLDPCSGSTIDCDVVLCVLSKPHDGSELYGYQNMSMNS